VTCDADSYVLNPNDGRMCMACPRGLRCFGNEHVESRVAGANWTVQDGTMRLHSCPAGYRVQPPPSGRASSSFDTALQECVACGLGEECTAPPCVTCSLCAPGAYKDSSEQRPCTACPANTFLASPGAQSLSSCTLCPTRSSTRGLSGQSSDTACACDPGLYLAVHRDGLRSCERCPRGAVCDGSSLSTRGGLDETGQVVWERDEDGLFHLKQCPRGYRLDTAAQECQRCGPGEYILASDDPSLECRPCITGMWCVGGGPPSSQPPLEGQLRLSGLGPAQLASPVALTAMIEAVLSEVLGGGDAVVSVTLPNAAIDSDIIVDLDGTRRADADSDEGLLVDFQAVSDGQGSEALQSLAQAAPFSDTLASALADRGLDVVVAVPTVAVAENVGPVGGFEIRGGAAVLVSCPKGHLLVNSSLDAQHCKRCEGLTYSVDPLDACGQRAAKRSAATASARPAQQALAASEGALLSR